MEILNKIWSYLTFKKQDGPRNLNIRMMHGINKISIFMFLAAVLYMVYRFAIK